jgi:hypothetical protein
MNEYTTSADWLAPDALVVGFLTIGNEGISFRSLVPNPTRSFAVGVEQIERVSPPSTQVGRSSAVELVVRGHGPMVFLVAEPRACGLALEELVARFKARSAYR